MHLKIDTTTKMKNKYYVLMSKTSICYAAAELELVLL